MKTAKTALALAIIAAWLLALATAFTGCALNRPSFRIQTTSTNGTVTVQEMRLTSLAFWPATIDLAKQKAGMGKTWSLGTEGLKEETGGTNLSATLDSLTRLLQTIR